MEIEEKDVEILDRLMSRTRLYEREQADMKYLYDKYIKKNNVIDWKCPICLRGIMDDLIRFRKNAKIKKDKKK
jgi:hypothetical protein